MTIRYDRAAESNLENLTRVQRDARVTSAHGFSESTADAVGRPAIRRGTQADPTGAATCPCLMNSPVRTSMTSPGPEINR